MISVNEHYPYKMRMSCQGHNRTIFQNPIAVEIPLLAFSISTGNERDHLLVPRSPVSRTSEATVIRTLVYFISPKLQPSRFPDAQEISSPARLIQLARCNASFPLFIRHVHQRGHGSFRMRCFLLGVCMQPCVSLCAEASLLFLSPRGLIDGSTRVTSFDLVCLTYTGSGSCMRMHCQHGARSRGAPCHRRERLGSCQFFLMALPRFFSSFFLTCLQQYVRCNLYIGVLVESPTFMLVGILQSPAGLTYSKVVEFTALP